MEVLIENVRKYPCLWNNSHELYRDFKHKSLIWDRVAKGCDIKSGDSAKSQWKKIRNSHREAMRRRKNGNLHTWKYEELMNFLVPETESDTQDSVHDTTTDVSTNNSTIETSLNYQEALLRTPSPVESVTRDRKSDIADMLGQLLEERQKHSNSKDALANLFDSLCQKTRNLPKPLQLRVQREVFEVVIRAEEEALYNK